MKYGCLDRILLTVVNGERNETNDLVPQLTRSQELTQERLAM